MSHFGVESGRNVSFDSGCVRQCRVPYIRIRLRGSMYGVRFAVSRIGGSGCVGGTLWDDLRN